MKPIVVGSRAFFSGMEGFRSKDKDFIILESNPIGYKWRREQSLRGICTFFYKLEPAIDMIRRTISNGDPLLVGKFLVPEFANAIGATIDDICQLEKLVLLLDDKHAYYKVIFNAYISNNAFYLTDEQRDAAFKLYQEAREIDNKRKK